jgi:hypothetical protein
LAIELFRSLLKHETVVAPLSAADYERLRRHARTHREELVIRLCGEAGLRPAEIAALTPADVAEVDGTGVATLDEHPAVLPRDVEHDLRKYVASNDIGADERVVSVSPRRVQMLVREVADRAAAETGDDRFRSVSTQALREHFVLASLRAGVDPRLVAAAAGFDSIAALAPYLDDPSLVELAAAFGDAADARAEGGSADLPTALDTAMGLLDSLTGTLGDAESPAALFETAVDRAASVDGYRYAWVARRTTDDVDVLAHAGVDPAVVDADLQGLEAHDYDGVGVDASNDADGDGGGRLGAGDIRGVRTFVVAETEGATYVLGLGVESGVSDDAVLAVHEATAALVGRAFEAVRRRQLLVADVVTELRFDVGDANAVVPRLARALETSLHVDGVVPGGPGLVLYVEVGGGTPQSVVDTANGDADVERVRYLDDGETGPVVELAVSRSPARTLVDLDAQVTAYHADPDSAELGVAVATDADVRAIVESATDAHPGLAIVAQETVERTADAGMDFQSRLRNELTDRQFAVLQAAYHGGYFQWPRESTGEELADSLSVAAPTLHNHLRVAQSKLLDAFFDA